MAHIPSLKGVRTRFRNILDREVTNARSIINSDVAVYNKDRFIQDASKCSKLISIYCKKLEEQMTKFTDAIGESDSDLLEKVLDEDCDLILSAEQCSVEIEQLMESIDKKRAESEVKAEQMHLKETQFEDVIEMQHTMQKMMSLQIKQQNEFLEAQKKKECDTSSVKLPKLDLNAFGGNKMQWTAFWDAFECTVHSNKKLSHIEKFNYLLSKLHGEARRSIAGLALSNENYDVAINILKERFGNKQEAVTLHYKVLLRLTPASTRIESLRTFLDEVERHLRSLDVMGEDINQQVFVSMITSKLPEEVMKQLELNKGAKSEWTTDQLRQQLFAYVAACEKAQRATRDNNDKSVITSERNKYQFPQKSHQTHQGTPLNIRPSRFSGSAETLFVKAKQASDKRFSDKCRYCAKSHWSDECSKYKTLIERKSQLKDSCYKCLKAGHVTRDCKTRRKCVYCGQYDMHHRGLCPKKFESPLPSSVHMSEELSDTAEHETTEYQQEGPALISSNEIVLMQTAKTNVINPNNSKAKSVRLLLDSGSQRTYITENLAKALGLRGDEEQELKLTTFGNKNAKIVKTKITQLGITLRNGTHMSVTANIVPTISGAIQRNPLKQKLSPEMEQLIKSVDLADTFPTEQESSTLEVLIGNDYYLDVVLPQRIEVTPGLYLLNSKFGWMLTGRTSEVNCDKHDIQMLVQTYGTDVMEHSVFSSIDEVIPTKPDLEDFWNLESIGVTDKETSSEDQLAMDNFKETLKFDNGRYHVTWPWKEEDPDLPVNKELAYGRLKSCVRKLGSKPELFEKYDSILQDQLKKGIIEKVDSQEKADRTHYIPHHAVLSPKFRVVYDASAKTRPDYQSLNECLYRGPVMLHDLGGLLIRFRMHPIAIVSDIEKAFLQVGLQSSQRDVTRFLWLRDGDSMATDRKNIQEYRFCRVPFGVISSPFLLGATIEAHLDGYKTAVANQLKSDIYCDNVITGTASDIEAIQFYEEATQIFKCTYASGSRIVTKLMRAFLSRTEQK